MLNPLIPSVAEIVSSIVVMSAFALMLIIRRGNA